MSNRTVMHPLGDVIAVLPHRAHDIARLEELGLRRPPVVTVVGKYNHGKSRLLNELVGGDVFSVADRRETRELSEYRHGNVHWFDAPGLDADVGTEDDRHALHATWLKSDIRLFVHAAKEGELDAKELALLNELDADGRRTQRQTLLLLSQIDQVPDGTELSKVVSALHRQAPQWTIHAISVTRHRQGIEGSKALLVERSGLPQLRLALQEALGRVAGARAHETAVLLREIRQELEQRCVAQMQILACLEQGQIAGRETFDRHLLTLLARLAVDIEEVLDAPVPDYAIVPDTSQDKYRITQAKLERARIQIAYSRACIQIDSFLVGQGVNSLPSSQHTAAGSLNSVMVAVMGVSVKFRKDLRAMFCDVAGRERLHGEFAHYYELSVDRAALREKTSETKAAIAATQSALAAVLHEESSE